MADVQECRHLIFFRIVRFHGSMHLTLDFSLGLRSNDYCDMFALVL